jgi:hypothetical protein
MLPNWSKRLNSSKMGCSYMRSRISPVVHRVSVRRPSGYVFSFEILMIGLILSLGLITGWAKLRDQSLAEIKDTMAAIDTYVQGSQNLWNTGGTRWINNNTIVEPGTLGDVNEGWGSSNTQYLLANDPDSDGYYTPVSGALVYRGPSAASRSNSAAAENGSN